MTTAREQLLRKIEQTPDFVVQEVLDFLLFIKLRLGQETGEEAIVAPEESPTLPPFLQFVEEISAQIPREEWEKLPFLRTSIIIGMAHRRMRNENCSC